MHAHGFVLARKLDGELGLGIGTQVRHKLRLVVAYVGQDFEELVGERQGQRHIFLGVDAGVAEHHSLVTGTLVLRLLAHDAAVDVGALLVYGGDDSAGGSIKSVFRLGVAYLPDDAAHGVLHVHIGILAAHLAADHYESAGAECFTSYFRLPVLAEEFIKDGI